MLACACKSLKNPCAVFGLAALISALALAAALTGQFVYNLHPCVLCLYQRVPFMVAVGLGIAGLGAHKNARLTDIILTLLALAFLINAGIATYHTGVEMGWWRSFVEGCAVPKLEGNSDEWIDKILSNPSVPCTEVQWRDPVIGLTMANYNVLLCLGLFAMCAMALCARRCPSGTKHQKQP